MKITAISVQVKNIDRYSIYIDEKYAFSLSSTVLLDSKLVVGQELNAEEVASYKELSSNDKLYGRVLRYIAMRPRSVNEVEQYLKKKTKDENAAEIIQKLKSKNLLDDEAFARSWVESRRLLKPVSRRRLVAELQQKRVNPEIIDKVLGDRRDDIALQQLIAKKRNQPKYVADPQKFLAYLARQGFNYDDIKRALDNADDI